MRGSINMLFNQWKRQLADPEQQYTGSMRHLWDYFLALINV